MSPAQAPGTRVASYVVGDLITGETARKLLPDGTRLRWHSDRLGTTGPIRTLGEVAPGMGPEHRGVTQATYEIISFPEPVSPTPPPVGVDELRAQVLDALVAEYDRRGARITEADAADVMMAVVTAHLAQVDASMSRCPNQSDTSQVVRDLEAETERLRAENQALTDQVAACRRAATRYHRVAHRMQVQRDRLSVALREMARRSMRHRRDARSLRTGAPDGRMPG